MRRRQTAHGCARSRLVGADGACACAVAGGQRGQHGTGGRRGMGARAVGEEAASGLGALGFLGSSIARPFSSPAPTHCSIPAGAEGRIGRHTYIHPSLTDPSTQHQPEQSHVWVQSGGVTVKGVRETRRDTQLVCSQLARRFSRTLFGSCSPPAHRVHVTGRGSCRE